MNPAAKRKITVSVPNRPRTARARRSNADGVGPEKYIVLMGLGIGLVYLAAESDVRGVDPAIAATMARCRDRPTLSEMGGDKPLGLAIGGVLTVAFALLPALAVAVFYLVANVSALIIGADFDSDPNEPAVLLVGLVGTVTFLVLTIAGGVALIGRRLSPKNRDD